MARSKLGFASLPALTLLVACATAVDQGFDDDGSDGSGGSLSSLGGTTTGGNAQGTAGKTTGSGGKTTGAFGGSASTAGTGDLPQAGGDTGGTTTAGSSTGGSTAGSSTGGKSSGGTGGTTAGSSTGGTTAGSSTSGGTGGTTTGSSGSGSGGTTGSTGDCAPANTGWVVQYWTNTAASEMPAGDLRIFNNNGGSVNFTQLELRHYFTNEETASMSFIFSTFGHNFPAMPYYEDEQGGNVLSSIKNVTPAAPNASQYISITFNNKPGSFANNEWAQLGFYGSLAMYPKKSDQSNDYTYIGHPTSDPGSGNKTTGWNRMTLYVDGDLVWGCEP